MERQVAVAEASLASREVRIQAEVNKTFASARRAILKDHRQKLKV